MWEEIWIGIFQAVGMRDVGEDVMTAMLAKHGIGGGGGVGAKVVGKWFMCLM